LETFNHEHAQASYSTSTANLLPTKIQRQKDKSDTSGTQNIFVHLFISQNTFLTELFTIPNLEHKLKK